METLQRMSSNQRIIFSTGLPIVGLVLFIFSNWNHVQVGAQIENANTTFSLVLTLLLAGSGVLLAYLSTIVGTSNNDERLKKSLEVCQANVMVADNDFNIVYMNQSVENMMKENDRLLREAIPGFDANQLLGKNVDSFHKNPSHQRSMVSRLNQPYKTDLKINGITFGLVATPLFSDRGERIGTVVEWYDKTKELALKAEQEAIAVENLRVRQALDNVTTNAMIADSDGLIVYTNQSVEEMLRIAESDIRKDLPQFTANKVLGSNFDIFHKNPAHQRSMLSSLTSTFRTQIEVGGRTFSLVANPVTNESGNKIGTVVEWNDRTHEVKTEREVDSLVTKATLGDLSVRLEEKGKTGFMLNLSKGLNRLMDTTEEAVGDTARVLDALAHGNLTQKIERDYKGSFGKLKNDANATVEKLIDIIGGILESANAVSGGADEIAQGNTDLSQRTEEQASSLEETASSMEEMTSTVKQSSENAQHANRLSMDAQSKAEKGGAVVADAVKAMSEINNSSKRIADIIGVIDEIAFQTNLLALNAAVEAARAGEQGRGFAVVAGEVRNLAQRSAGAAKEIKDLIRDSVNKVDDGTELVNQSGETLKDIVAAVQQVCRMMSDISTASMEQTSGIEQVNVAISQMDEMTQQNAALVEQASAAGEALSEQARQLMKLIGFFTVDESAVKVSHSAPMHAARGAVKSKAKAKAKAPSSSNQAYDSGDVWEEF